VKFGPTHLAVALIALSGCMTFQKNDARRNFVPILESPTGGDPIRIHVMVDYQVSGIVVTKQMEDSSENAIKNWAESSLARDDRFEIVTTPSDAEYHLAIQSHDSAKPNLALAFLTGLTLYLIPSVSVDSYQTTVTIRDATGREIGSRVYHHELQLVQHIILLLGTPFATIGSVSRTMWQEILLDAAFWTAETLNNPTMPVPDQLGEPDRPKTRSGTCFAVSPDGLLLTAHHVVEGAIDLTISFDGMKQHSAKVLQSSPGSDLALLKVDFRTQDYLPIAPPRSARLGQKVFTVGYPAIDVLGSAPKYSEGTISALSGIQGEASLMQVSVPIQPGNSGGPLIDESGRVVGIITSTAAIAGFIKATGSLPQNVNWAVKSEIATLLFDEPQTPKSFIKREEVISAATRATCLIVAE
jgi:S1-C subfamily serine protease